LVRHQRPRQREDGGEEDRELDSGKEQGGGPSGDQGIGIGSLFNDVQAYR
jgi:hypothetical protein